MMFFFRSAINPPTTGDSTFAAYLAAVKALGSNAPNVGRSLVPQASVYLLYLGRYPGFLHWPSNGWYRCNCDCYAFVIQSVLVLIHKPRSCQFFFNSFGAAFGMSDA
jgi:hypothetical protein